MNTRTQAFYTCLVSLAVAAGGCGGNDTQSVAGRDLLAPNDQTNLAPEGVVGGTMACADWFACAEPCGKDSSCIDGCLEQLTSGAFEALSNLLDCANAVHCTGSVCLNTLCGPQMDACFEPQAAAPGPTAGLSCYGWTGCLHQCNGDGPCRKQCSERLSDAGLADAEALVNCVERFDCTETACMEQNCPAELARCSQ